MASDPPTKASQTSQKTYIIYPIWTNFPIIIIGGWGLCAYNRGYHGRNCLISWAIGMRS